MRFQSWRSSRRIARTSLRAKNAIDADDSGNLLMLVGVEPKLLAILDRTGVAAKIGKEYVVPAQSAILGALEMSEPVARAWIERNASPAPASRVQTDGVGYEFSSLTRTVIRVRRSRR
jgi:hypothetical protein